MKFDRLHVTLGLLLALGIGFRAMRERHAAPASAAAGTTELDRQIDKAASRRKGASHKPPPVRSRSASGSVLPAGSQESGAIRMELTPVGARPAEAAVLTASPGGAARPGSPLRINLDLASAASIESLPRIGPALAQRIVEDRKARGPFGSLAGLDRVKGVGPALQKEIAPYVTFSPSGRPSTVATIPQPEERSGRGKGRRRPPASAVR